MAVRRMGFVSRSYPSPKKTSCPVLPGAFSSLSKTIEATRCFIRRITTPNFVTGSVVDLEVAAIFLRTLINAAMIATPSEYSLLRPVLVSLRAQDPEPMSSVVTLITDDYRVTFSQMENVDAMTCAFNKFKSTVFDNGLPDTAIRWASSIQSLRYPGMPIGLLALPDDPTTHRLPNQMKLETAHIFLSDKVKKLALWMNWCSFTRCVTLRCKITDNNLLKS